MSTSALDRAIRHLEAADGHSQSARVIASDRDDTRRQPGRGRRLKADTETRAALNDLTRGYRRGTAR